MQAGFDNNVHSGFQVNLHASFVGVVHAGFFLEVLADLEGHVLADFVVLIADEFAGIVFDAVIHVLFGVDENLLAALFVLEAKFVVVGGAAALGAAGHEGGARLVVRERVCRHLVVVVDAAGNDRAVGVAFEEFDNHFLPDARDGDRAPVFAGPGLGNAHPARAVLVLLTQPVPEKLHLHAAVLIRVNLLARGTYYDGSLRALHYGLWSEALRTKRYGEGDAREMVGVSLLGAAT